jgi:hypothetical protein
MAHDRGTTDKPRNNPSTRQSSKPIKDHSVLRKETTKENGRIFKDIQQTTTKKRRIKHSRKAVSVSVETLATRREPIKHNRVKIKNLIFSQGSCKADSAHLRLYLFTFLQRVVEKIVTWHFKSIQCSTCKPLRKYSQPPGLPSWRHCKCHWASYP